MKSFRQFLNEQKRMEIDGNLLLEHECYNLVPDTKNSYREDPANTSTLTQKHSHVYAKRKGKGREIYAVTTDGRGHDGSSGIQIQATHADYFRSLGYNIGADNILEAVSLAKIDATDFQILLG